MQLNKYSPKLINHLDDNSIQNLLRYHYRVIFKHDFHNSSYYKVENQLFSSDFINIYTQQIDEKLTSILHQINDVNSESSSWSDEEVANWEITKKENYNKALIGLYFSRLVAPQLSKSLGISLEKILDKISLIEQNQELLIKNQSIFGEISDIITYEQAKELAQEHFTFHQNNFKPFDFLNPINSEYLKHLTTFNFDTRLEDLIVQDSAQFQESLIAFDHFIQFSFNEQMPNILESVNKIAIYNFKLYSSLLFKSEKILSFNQYLGNLRNSVFNQYSERVKDNYEITSKNKTKYDKAILAIEAEAYTKHIHTFNADTLFFNEKIPQQERIINQQFSKVCNIFSQSYKSNTISLQWSKDKRFIRGEYNDRAFYAHPDPTIDIYDHAWIAYSFNKEQQKWFENLISKNMSFEELKEKVYEQSHDEHNNILIPATNYRNLHDISKEFKTDWVQEFFFSNKEAVHIENNL